MNFYKPIHKENFYTYKNKCAIQFYWDLDKLIFNDLLKYIFEKDGYRLTSRFYSVLDNEIYVDYEFQYKFGYQYSGDLDLCLYYCKEVLSGIISQKRFQELITREFKHI